MKSKPSVVVETDAVRAPFSCVVPGLASVIPNVDIKFVATPASSPVTDTINPVESIDAVNPPIPLIASLVAVAKTDPDIPPFGAANPGVSKVLMSILTKLPVKPPPVAAVEWSVWNTSVNLCPSEFDNTNDLPVPAVDSILAVTKLLSAKDIVDTSFVVEPATSVVNFLKLT